MRIKDHARIRGRIAAIRITERPRGMGWGWIRDPKSGLFFRHNANSNMIVLAGLSMLAKSIQYGHADSGKTLRYLATGTGSTTPAKGNTALVAEVARLAIDSWDNTGIAADPVVMIASKLFLTTESNGALMECGLFQESAGAPMFCRGLFGYGLISNATQANPVVIESIGHGLSDGDKILIEGVQGMTELNDNAYFVDELSADTFGLYSDEDLTTPIDGSGFGAYEDASPNTATWKTIIPKTAAETLTITYSLTFPVE